MQPSQCISLHNFHTRDPFDAKTFQFSKHFLKLHQTTLTIDMHVSTSYQTYYFQAEPNAKFIVFFKKKNFEKS
jgi:hypothetical protein